MIPAWCSAYIGIPFAPRGRDHAGCDCYGLVRLVLDEQFGTRLPSFAGGYEDPFEHEAIGALVAQEAPLLGGERLDEPELGAVAVITIASQPCHLGIYVGDGMILHARERKGVVLERESSVFIRGHVEGYYRAR